MERAWIAQRNDVIKAPTWSVVLTVFAAAMVLARDFDFRSREL